ncbi:MAG: NAD(P)-binding domain-containing protein [Bacteriovoracaceae bacterium]|nr:NAD(P)-binding domain-containing protein [Bacteriovoracaceae bacterium]
MKIGIIGCGNMASAIARGLSVADHSIEFYCYNRSPEKAQNLANDISGKFCQKLNELDGCDFLLLGVKPQNLNDVAIEINQAIKIKTHLVSMLAGKSLEVLAKTFPHLTVTRIMPNLPMLVGEGINLTIHHSQTSPTLSQKIEKMLSHISLVVPLTTEEQFDYAMMVTASGPAYLFEIARILETALEQKNIPNAHEIAAKLFVGSSQLMQEDFATLRNQITSKGGVTEKALAELAKNNLENNFKQALENGFNHAQALNKA